MGGGWGSSHPRTSEIDNVVDQGELAKVLAYVLPSEVLAGELAKIDNVVDQGEHVMVLAWETWVADELLVQILGLLLGVLHLVFEDVALSNSVDPFNGRDAIQL